MMFTFFDLMIVVVMALTAAAVVSVALMFLSKNRIVQRVCLYITAALGVYIGTVGFRINWLGFELQAGLAIALALICIVAVVLERIKKDDAQMFRLSSILAAVALVAGMVNAFLI
jgi:hypothetical protein